MGLFKSPSQLIDEQIKYGFELAIRYAELAVEYNKDPIKLMKETLKNWED